VLATTTSQSSTSSRRLRSLLTNGTYPHSKTIETRESVERTGTTVLARASSGLVDGKVTWTEMRKAKGTGRKKAVMKMRKK
jgi:hypothetical protein